MPPAKVFNPESPCPCGSQQLLNVCCLPYIQLRAQAPTAERLMRSRYTAHVLLEIDYLWETWSPDQRMRSSKEDIRAWAESCEWLQLQILSTKAGLESDDQGLVSFVALFRQNGELQKHSEISVFKKVFNRWLYVDHQH
jgi:SEC-C motif-containing protein